MAATSGQQGLTTPRTPSRPRALAERPRALAEPMPQSSLAANPSGQAGSTSAGPSPSAPPPPSQWVEPYLLPTPVRPGGRASTDPYQVAAEREEEPEEVD